MGGHNEQFTHEERVVLTNIPNPNTLGANPNGNNSNPDPNGGNNAQNGNPDPNGGNNTPNGNPDPNGGNNAPNDNPDPNGANAEKPKEEEKPTTATEPKTKPTECGGYCKMYAALNLGIYGALILFLLALSYQAVKSVKKIAPTA